MRPHLGRLIATATQIINRRDLANDIVQDALWALYHEPEEPPAVGGWLVKAVINRGLHAARTERRRFHHEAHHRAMDSMKPDREACAGCELVERQQILARALSALSEEHREILELHTHSEMDYESLAIRLGVPVGTIRSRLARARASLRRALLPHAASLGYCPECAQPAARPTINRRTMRPRRKSTASGTHRIQ